MQNKKLKHEFVLLAVPVELLGAAGIFEGNSLTVYATNNKLVIENCNDEFICNGDCENCPVNDVDCDGECDDCPCNGSCDESGVE